jgi:HK97 family phage portal protein
MGAAIQAKEWNRLRWRPKSIEVFAQEPESTRSSPEDPSINFATWLDMVGAGDATGAGVSVSNESAMRQIAVWACIRLHAETFAAQPAIVYRRTSAGGKDRADDHDVYPILHDAWNEYQTSFIGRETMQAQVVGRGNTYAVIERDRNAYLLGLWPVPCGCIEPVIANGALWYVVTSDGTERLGVKPGVYAAADILHIPGLGYDGVRGYNPIQLAREGIGLGMAAERFGGTLFGNGATPTGILTTETRPDEPTQKQIKNAWNEIHSGVYNSHKTALLTGGMKYQQISINPEEAQFLDTRKFQISEIARLFRLPPSMIGAPSGDSQTYANHEQRMLEFAQMSIRPWNVRWEQELNRKLFTPRERSRYFVEFNMDGILRADIKTRYESFSLALDRWLTRNEIRDLDNRNPVDGGDLFQTPQPAPVLPGGAKA